MTKRKRQVKSLPDGWLIDNRYQIYRVDGAIYDTKEAKDIPQDVFEIRDNLISGTFFCSVCARWGWTRGPY